MINKLGSPLLSFLSDKVFWSRVYRVVFEEDVAPLVLDEEEAVGEDEDHGEHDHQHHHQPAVQVTHRNQILFLGNK